MSHVKIFLNQNVQHNSLITKPRLISGEFDLSHYWCLQNLYMHELVLWNLSVDENVLWNLSVYEIVQRNFCLHKKQTSKFAILKGFDNKKEQLWCNYRIYSSERPGRSFNFEFSNGGAYSREALIKYIKETSKYFQFVS